MKILKAFRQYRNYRTTVIELNRLSNRELSDLGISRCDIESIAFKATY